VILVDANLLIYSQVSELKEHPAASAWFDDRLNDSGSRVGLPWSSLLAFIRIVANPRVFRRSTTVTAAWERVERWLELETVWIPTPTGRHPGILKRLLAETGEEGDLVPDAHLAALAIEHGLRLCSADRGFARFSGLRWENPLAKQAGQR
jgi:uncharacterized protein